MVFFTSLFDDELAVSFQTDPLDLLVLEDASEPPIILTGLTQNINISIENLSYFPSFLKSLCYKSVLNFVIINSANFY